MKLSFEAYISLMIGTVLVAIIGLFNEFHTAKSEAPDVSSSTNNKSRNILSKYKWKKVRIVVIFGLWASISIWLTYTYISSRKDEYMRKTAQAYQEAYDRNYSEATRLFDEALSLAYNSETECEALYNKAVFYLLAATITEDETYLSKALVLYNQILIQQKYKMCESYRHVYVDIAEFFSYHSSDKYNIDLPGIISMLENTYDFSDLDSIADTDILFMSRVASTLSLYYEYAAADSIEKKSNSNTYKEYIDKAFFYCDVALDLIGRSNILYYCPYIDADLYSRMSDIMVNATFYATIYSSDIHTLHSELNSVIKFCTYAIDYLNTLDNGDYTSSYINIVINLGRAYVYSGLFIDEDYYEKAYNVLHPLLQMRNEDIVMEIHLLDAGRFLALTHRCTSDDIEIILDRYESLIEQLSSSQNFSIYISAMESACRTCDSIIYAYEDSERAQNLKNKYSRELEDLSVPME